MLNNIRNFSKTFFAKILLVIIIIPFVFWGMGGVFNSGNTNNIAKINDFSISTQDFINHINSSNIKNEIIKKNIEKNIIEDLLSELISRTLIKKEIESLNIKISDNTLVKTIKNNQNFLIDKKFSRKKKKKFLLQNNMTAASFEVRLKDNESQKQLFSYISGGIKTPTFMAKKIFKEQNSKIEIDYVNLKNNYKKIEEFNNNDLEVFVKENKEKLKKEYIDFTYFIVTPEILTGSELFGELFFKKIDELENKIADGIDIILLSKDLNVKPVIENNYILNDKKDFKNKIYKKRESNKIEILENGDFYIVYKINKINRILPTLKDNIFKKQITKILFEKNKFNFNNEIVRQINEAKFNQGDFDKIGSTNIKNTIINSIRDDNIFSLDSIKMLYSLSQGSFSLIADKEKDIYLVKIKNLYQNEISKDDNKYKNYVNQANMDMRDKMYSSYDYFLNDKYKVIINEKTLERVKNYFK